MAGQFPPPPPPMGPHFMGPPMGQPPIGVQVPEFRHQPAMQEPWDQPMFAAQPHVLGKPKGQKVKENFQILPHYEGSILRKALSKQSNRSSWSVVAKEAMSFGQSDLAQQCKERKKSPLTEYNLLSSEQRQQIDRIIEKRTLEEGRNSNVEWVLAYVRREIKERVTRFTRVREVAAIHVIVKRQDRFAAESSSKASSSGKKANETIKPLVRGVIVDITDPPGKSKDTPFGSKPPKAGKAKDQFVEIIDDRPFMSGPKMMPPNFAHQQPPPGFPGPQMGPGNPMAPPFGNPVGLQPQPGPPFITHPKPMTNPPPFGLPPMGPQQQMPMNGIPPRPAPKPKPTKVKTAGPGNPFESRYSPDDEMPFDDFFPESPSARKSPKQNKGKGLPDPFDIKGMNNFNKMPNIPIRPGNGKGNPHRKSPPPPIRTSNERRDSAFGKSPPMPSREKVDQWDDYSSGSYDSEYSDDVWSASDGEVSTEPTLDSHSPRSSRGSFPKFHRKNVSGGSYHSGGPKNGYPRGEVHIEPGRSGRQRGRGHGQGYDDRRRSGYDERPRSRHEDRDRSGYQDRPSSGYKDRASPVYDEHLRFDHGDRPRPERRRSSPLARSPQTERRPSMGQRSNVSYDGSVRNAGRFDDVIEDAARTVRVQDSIIEEVAQDAYRKGKLDGRQDGHDVRQDRQRNDRPYERQDGRQRKRQDDRQARRESREYY